MNQKHSTFKGGIQSGTSATSDFSKKLDNQVKECRDLLDKEFSSNSRIKVIKRMSRKQKIDLVGDDCFGFQPDGGMWFIDDKLIAVFEAKKQGKAGNAHERWWDNACTAKYINSDVLYVTFCCGESAGVNGSFDKMARKAKIMLGDNFQTYLSPEGFNTLKVYNVMKETIERCL